MAGRWELGLPRASACSLKEQLARTTVNNVRSQGHPYVELRGNGKRFIFFCTLCLAPCYSDAVLLDHLKGTLHNERLSAAKLTLLKENPWPFSDGVNFFDCNVGSGACQKQLVVGNGNCSRVVESRVNGDSLAIVKYREDGCNKRLNVLAEKCDLVIPCVLMKDEVSDLKVKFMGSGRLAARFCEKGKGVKEIRRIWCEWLGDNDHSQRDNGEVMDHDYAIVTFSYKYELGSGLLDDVKLLLSSSPQSEIENGEPSNKKRKKSFSDPEDTSDSLSNQYDSAGEESTSSNGSSTRLLLDRYDDQLLQTRFISSKAIRRELRRQQRIAAERMCDICQQKMLPEKDVAALMNVKTGKLACSSRNENGAFHVFHVSCLIHWVLFCELEMTGNQSVGAKVRRRSRRKNGATKCGEMGKNGKLQIVRTQIDSVFCPECQGTGLDVEGDEFETPTFPLSEMFKFKIKVSDGRRGWMRSPEVLDNCSTGFYFASQSSEGEIQEKVLPLKLLQFYRAVEQG